MSFETKFIPEATDTYQAIVEQVRQRWGETQVQRLEEKIGKCLSAIKIAPYMYPVADENTGMRKCVLHKTALCFTE